MAKKSCKKGYYYCNTDKKCKKVPKGWHVIPSTGYLMRDSEHKEEEKNGNGDGTNGNGGSNGGSDGGGVSESKDHEVAMAQSQLKKSEENIRKLRRALDEEVIAEKRDGKSAKDKGYSLRDWFKGGGWVQTGGKYDGKPCARQPGQKTKPFCRDADDRASMSKKERERRAKKKRREDPIATRKGKAKMVSASYSNWRSDLEQLDENIFNLLNPQKRQEVKQDVRQGTHHKNTEVKKGSILSNISKRNDLLRQLENQSYQPEGEIVDEGKKDACYHKVKSRYSVWPSAYASGALVKCRKVGAKNWGNKTKKESYEFSNWRDDFQATEYETVDIIKPEPLQPSQSVIDEAGKKCWKGYKKAGTQKLFGKTYNRCVKAHFSDWRADMDLQEKESKPDYLDFDGDGNKEESMKKALKDKRKVKKEEVELQEAMPGYEKYNAAVKAANKLTGRDKIEALLRAAQLRPPTEKEVNQKLGEDWQKSNRKDGVDGMSQKSVNAYRRENPGSKLQTAVTGKVKKGSKDAKRRKSFCDRSDGQRKMHNIDCKKTPDKKICKARRRWRCR